MTIVTVPAGSGPAEQIYIIRHGEKPPGPSPITAVVHAPGPPFGVDLNGDQDEHSLTPQGWQRAGALAVLFDPAIGPLRTGISKPGAVFSPLYKDKPQNERTYQTVLPLSLRLGISTETLFGKADVKEMAGVAVGRTGVVLICWEHENIPSLAKALPTVNGKKIPGKWPGDRFDVVWSFTLAAGTGSPQYEFSQIPQLLLSGDKGSKIKDKDGS